MAAYISTQMDQTVKHQVPKIFNLAILLNQLTVKDRHNMATLIILSLGTSYIHLEWYAYVHNEAF